MQGFKDFIQHGPYDAYCKQLKEVCDNRKLTLIKIGEVNSHPMYCIEVNNSKKNYICISAGIHGDEAAGPWAVIKMLETVNLKGRDHNYIIFPIVNPNGFDLHKRRNHLDLDLNRHFRDKDMPYENKIILKNLKNKDICLLYSLHEHPSAKGFYIYCSNDIDHGISNRIMTVARKHRFKIRTNHFGKKAPGGEVRLHKLEGDSSFEDKMFEEKVPYIVIETPGYVNFGRRVLLQYDLLKLTIDNYEEEELY